MSALATDGPVAGVPAPLVASSAAATARKLQWVQVLRAAAAILVLMGHAQGQVEQVAQKLGGRFEPVSLLPGGFGVDLFFCVSGFIMVVASERLFGRPHAWKTFMTRRAIRLVPLYWLVTLLYLPLLLRSATGFRGDLPAALLTSLLFVPYPTYGTSGGLVFPLLTLGWTLNYEIFFYGLFAAAVVLPRRQAAAAVLAGLLTLALAGAAWQPGMTAPRFWTQPIILEFGFGVLIGLWWSAPAWLPRGGCIVLAVAALAAVLLDPFGMAHKAAGASTANDLRRVIGWGLPAALLLVAAVGLEKLPAAPSAARRLFAHLGDCSYSLYLTHPIVLLFVVKGWTLWRLDLVAGWTVLVPVLIVVSLAFACLVYRFVERPMTQALERHVR